MPKIASLVPWILFLLLHPIWSKLAEQPRDREVEDGEQQRQEQFYNLKQKQYQRLKSLAASNKQWNGNRSCRKMRPELSTDVCLSPRDHPKKCFSVQIGYDYLEQVPELDGIGTFPEHLEFLKQFPKCWSLLAPLVCFAHYRPCSLNANPDNAYYLMLQLTSKELCKNVKQACSVPLANLTNLPPYLDCENEQHQSEEKFIYGPHCTLSFYGIHKELNKLSTDYSHCRPPLVRINSVKPEVSPVVDECYMPCSSSLYPPKSLRRLYMFSTLCFSLVALAVVVTWRFLLNRTHFVFPFFHHSFNYDLTIIFLSLAFIFASASVFGLSAFVGEINVCLLDGLIRRDSSLPIDNDIDWCTLQAFALKFFIIFCFWSSFIIAYGNGSRNVQFLYLFGIFHAFLCPFLNLFNGEISVDPVLRICHFFRPHSSGIIAGELLSGLIVLGLIIWLLRNAEKKNISLDKLDSKQPFLEAESGMNKREEGPDQQFVVEDGNVPNGQNSKKDFSIRQQFTIYTPFLLIVINLLAVYSFYLPMDPKSERDLIMANVNCSLTRNWQNSTWSDPLLNFSSKQMAKEVDAVCQPVLLGLSWYYLNSGLVSLHFLLMIAIIWSAASKFDQSADEGSNRTNSVQKRPIERQQQMAKTVDNSQFSAGAADQHSDLYATIDSLLLTSNGLIQPDPYAANVSINLPFNQSPSPLLMPNFLETQLANMLLNKQLGEWMIRSNSLPNMANNGTNLEVKCGPKTDFGEGSSSRRRKISRLENNNGRRRKHSRLRRNETPSIDSTQSGTQTENELAAAYALKRTQQNQGNDETSAAINDHSSAHVLGNQQQPNVQQQAFVPPQLGPMLTPVIVPTLGGAPFLTFACPLPTPFNNQQLPGGLQNFQLFNNPGQQQQQMNVAEEQGANEEEEEDEDEEEDEEGEASSGNATDTSHSISSDSNDFCSDKADSEEERRWDEKCRKAAQRAEAQASAANSTISSGHGE